MIPDDALRRGFRASFGAEPEALVRVPGRINLVGDHIDYLLLPVLPMAVQRGIALAVRPRPDTLVRAANESPAFPAATFHAARPIPPAPGEWHDYLRAALHAVGARRGFDAWVASDLPAAAGLSSSSALVVAAALAALHVGGKAVAPIPLADALARGERFVGTEGGGMDQAAVLCAREGAALRIDFAPLRVRAIAVPAHWRVLVAPSLREARKSEALKAAYNERSQAARAAIATLAPGLAGDALLEWIRTAAPEPDTAPPRLRHVITEAQRVEAATAALEAGDEVTFGHTMTASHASLRDHYQVSTPELDGIVETALDAGALGARLTGAGFGGCAIALCTTETEAEVRRALAERFYRPRAATPAPVFTATPSAGATVTPL